MSVTEWIQLSIYNDYLIQYDNNYKFSKIFFWLRNFRHQIPYSSWLCIHSWKHSESAVLGHLRGFEIQKNFGYATRQPMVALRLDSPAGIETSLGRTLGLGGPMAFWECVGSVNPLLLRTGGNRLLCRLWRWQSNSWQRIICVSNFCWNFTVVERGISKKTNDCEYYFN